LDEIARRKKILIERCAQEREELAASLRLFHLPFNLGAVLKRAGKLLHAYPLAAGLSSLVVIGYGVKLTRAARKLLEAARKLLEAVRTIRPLWAWWSKRRRAK
jgi:hypothetical protein